MWTDWLTRLMPSQGPAGSRDTNRAFVDEVASARQREEAFRPLYEQLTFAQRVAESAVPIDRATIPLNLPLGPEKVKELSAQLKLSPYLKENLEVLVHGHQEDLEVLKRAEEAVKQLEARPELKIAEASVAEVQSLFVSLAASREQFRDYPLFYQLLGGGPEAAHGQPDELPESIRGFFAEVPGPDGALSGAPEVPAVSEPHDVLKVIGVPPLTLELGLDLVPMVDPALGGDLMDRVIPMRLAIAQDTGFIMPGIQFKDNMHLRPNTYRILVRGVPVATGDLLLGYWLAVEELLTDTTQELTGFPTTEPAFGRRAHWVGLAESKRAAALEYLVLTPMQALLMHLDETIRRHAHEMLALDDTQLMLDHLAEKMPHSVGAVIPMKVELAEYHLLLKNLLRERVSIRDQATILETVAHAVKPPQLDVMAPTPLYFNVLVDAHQQFLHQQMEKLMGVMPKLQSRNDPGMLLEKVRIGLSRSICAEAANDQGVVEVLTFDRRAEELLLELLDESPNGQDLLLPGSLHELLTKRLLGACERSGVEVLLVNARLRPHLKRLTSRNLPCLSVISHAEVHPDYRVQAIDTLALVEN